MAIKPLDSLPQCEQYETCETCPSSTARGETSPVVLREVDMHLARRIGDFRVPIRSRHYNRTLPAELGKEFGIDLERARSLVECAAKRDNGKCSMSPEEVKVNNQYL